ncbi:hypothetical protein RRF57_003222 [Xylaria bambusicola]|uniref:Hydrophobin n=1 Tax=Xylaria bambusicola TaxID=326684 RepID=A0AAN7UG97_9PEZI
MRFTVATIFTLAISAMAAPSTSLVVKGVPVVPGDVTVAQARDACGDKNTISCCNEVTQTSDTNTAEGVLAGLGLGQGGLLGNLNLVKGCSSIGVAARKYHPSSLVTSRNYVLYIMLTRSNSYWPG